MKANLIILTLALLGAGLWVSCNNAPAATAKDEAWVADFEQVKAAAAEQDRPILVNFTGSDWCGWCIRLEREVFSTDEFKAFAEQHLILSVIDFPRKMQQTEELVNQNRQLSQQYGVQGFPTILLLDADGNELARTGYRRGGAEAYVEHLKELISER